jgi:hypothetical protein
MITAPLTLITAPVLVLVMSSFNSCKHIIFYNNLRVKIID